MRRLNESTTRYDYIIVGSGSAGAIVAARLAEAPSVRVLLLEAGPKDNSLLFHVPAAMRYAYNARKSNWNYKTEPEPHLNSRTLVQPRGRVLGGSSSINGQLYLRGHPSDYDGWAKSGARGWSYADVLPYFKRLETWGGPPSEYRGTRGPIGVTTAVPGPLARAFLAAGSQAGYRFTDDVNAFQQDGFGLLPKNIAAGRRVSTAFGYLRSPPRNLHIRTCRAVTRILIRGRQAHGVEVLRGEKTQAVYADREVVICAGAFNSPVLLMQSGIGPAKHLREFGIEVVQDSPGVGENLMDHPLTAVQVACTEPVTLFGALGWAARTRGAIEWLWKRRGVFANNHFDAVAFVRSKAGVRVPNIQIALFPIAVAEGSADFVRQHAFQLQFSNQRPLSRGFVRLRGRHVHEMPRIRFNLLEHFQDVEELTAGFALARELLRQPALSRYVGTELFPGDAVVSDGDLESWLRDTCHSSYHPCGTCRMGDDVRAVVDSQCRVRGVTGLRVADASIMPRIPSANLNCPTMMIGEKAADHISGKDPLPPENLPVFTDPDWDYSQR